MSKFRIGIVVLVVATVLSGAGFAGGGGRGGAGGGWGGARGWRTFRRRAWLWRHAFRRWPPRRCEVRRLTFIFSRGLSRRPFFCRWRREELRPAPKRPGAI